MGRDQQIDQRDIGPYNFKRELLRIASPDGSRDAVLLQSNIGDVFVAVVARDERVGVLSMVAKFPKCKDESVLLTWLDSEQIEIKCRCRKLTTDAEVVSRSEGGWTLRV